MNRGQDNRKGTKRNKRGFKEGVDSIKEHN